MSLERIFIMTNKFNHLTFKDRQLIEHELNHKSSIKEIALLLNKDYSSIRKEIQKRKTKYAPIGYGDFKVPCKNRSKCFSKDKPCNFNASCYIKDECSKLNVSPHVCNGCKSRQGCRKERFTYFAKDAHDHYLIKISDSRKGIDISNEEIENINSIITPLIKDKGQSINHVFVNHPQILNFSKQTFYNYIYYNLFAFRNIDLPRRVKYKVRKNSKKRRSKAEAAIRQGRTYQDFLDYIEKHPNCNIVEMDTVQGIKGGKVLLTLLWRKSNFMLIYLMDKQTMNCVEDVFTLIKASLPEDYFNTLFEVILTDNGSEFFNPLSIECCYLTGEKLVSLFYCDPGASWQKGSLEKNHEFIRYILPKGSSFNGLIQDDCYRFASHINSLCRESLNNNCPFKAHLFIIDEWIINSLNIYYVIPDNVIINHKLI